MKKRYVYLISFVLLCMMFSTCYYFSYKSALEKFNQAAKENRKDLLSVPQIAANVQKESQQAQLEQNMTIQVDTRAEDIVEPSTKYILEVYDIVTKKLTSKEKSTPEYLIGLKREEIVTYLKDYMSHLSLEEFQAGLLSYELRSFSKDEIVLRKTYDTSGLKYEYFIVVEKGYVTVYYSDKKTVFEYTDIALNTLPEEEQEKLVKGIYAETLEEVYGILESYSS